MEINSIQNAIAAIIAIIGFFISYFNGKKVGYKSGKSDGIAQGEYRATAERIRANLQTKLIGEKMGKIKSKNKKK